MRNRWMVLSATLALLVIACTGRTTSSQPPATTVPPGTSLIPDTAPATEPPVTTEAPPAATPFADTVTPGEIIRLSSTHRVANVADDDVLNVRRVAGAGGPLVAELDPAYGLMRLTGEFAPAGDGGTWAQVVLADPAVQLVHDPEPYEVAWGWVNAFYAEPVTAFAPIGGSCSPGTLEPHAGDPSSTYDQVVDLTVLTFEECAQVIITLGEATEGGSLGVTLPSVSVAQPFGGAVRFGVAAPDAGWLQVLWPASEVFADGLEVYAARSSDGGIWFDVLGAVDAGVTYLPDQGQIVVNVVKGGPIPERDQTVAVADVVEGAGSVTVRGYARPFEASLSASVRDVSDTVVDVPVSGGTIYKPGPGAFGVMTTDWMEAWGWYEFTLDVSGLASGDYTLRLADDSANEDGPVITIPIPIP